jgi:hypothetical protein
VENKVKALLEQGLVAINIGLYDFAESLQTQGVKTIHVTWAPPAGGDQELMDLLDQLL